MKKLLIITLASIVLSSCNDEEDFDCLKSTGPTNKIERKVDFFTKINLQDNINLVFVPSDSQKLVVEGGKHLLPKVATEVKGDSLIISNRNYCNWVRSFDREIKVYVYGNPGISLYNFGYGKVSGKVTGKFFQIKSWSNENMKIEADLDFFWLETFKFGNTTLTGKVNRFMGFRHETGRFDMKNMTYCKDMLYHDHGQGTSFIKADSAATIRIFSSGNVECYGNPTVKHIEIEGTGEVIYK